MKILIAVPTYENIAPETFKSVYNLEIPDSCDAVFEFVRGYGAARARNLIGQKCLEGNFDAVLMVDSDIVLPKNSLELLIEGNTPLYLALILESSNQKYQKSFFLVQKILLTEFLTPTCQTEGLKQKVGEWGVH